MNIESLREHIETFDREVIESGFNRDVTDWHSSLPSQADNIVTLREIAEQLITALEGIYVGDLHASLEFLLPEGRGKPFMDAFHYEALKKLLANTEIAKEPFYSELYRITGELLNQINQNVKELGQIREFIAPYLLVDEAEISNADVATVSVVFRDEKTTSSLPEFVKSVHRWDMTLAVYHQIVKSDSPGVTQLVEVQNGSIDLIINLNVDVAVDLAQLFGDGFKLFAAYLAYKKLKQPILATFGGSKKLIKIENDIEKEFFKTIGTGIRDAITEQHNSRKKVDKKISDESIEAKINKVANLIEDHIVKGNDYKIIALPSPEPSEEESDEPDEYAVKVSELRDESSKTRKKLRLIPEEERQKLLEEYSHDEEETE